MGNKTGTHTGKHAQLPWMADVVVGSVLRGAGGKGPERVVRAIRRWPNGELAAVTFTIRHRSWTNDALTVVNCYDLMHQGYTSTGVVVKLESEMDKRIAAELMSPIGRPRRLCAADVRGIP